MRKHFYFFRHGQTNENQSGVREGLGKDAYLTEEGKQQAEALADFLADKPLDVIYSSPYKRAVDTAKIVALRHKDINILTDDALVEVVFGFWYTENQKQIDDNFRVIKNFLEKISVNDDYNNVAISAHGGVTRALCWAAGTKVEGIKNCQCFHFILDNGLWQYVECFETQIDVYNSSDNKN